MHIGRTARASGVSAKMIRHYEAIGLIPPARRNGAGYRQYRREDVHTLAFIRRARELGFSIEQIRELLALWQDRGRASRDVKRLAEAHIAELEARIARLQAMRDTLAELAEHCRGDTRPQCPILRDLEDGGTRTRPGV